MIRWLRTGWDIMTEDPLCIRDVRLADNTMELYHNGVRIEFVGIKKILGSTPVYSDMRFIKLTDKKLVYHVAYLGNEGIMTIEVVT